MCIYYVFEMVYLADFLYLEVIKKLYYMYMYYKYHYFIYLV